MSKLLEVSNVRVQFGGVVAVDDVSFSLNEGELLGFIGPNGAGKTTMMRAITGVVTPTSGSIVLDDKELVGLAVHSRVRMGLGFSQQLVKPFRNMTVLENVTLTAGSRHTRSPLGALFKVDRERDRTRAKELLELVGIVDAADADPSNLPLGYLKRLEVARALALDPTLLLLDEPLAGLNHAEAHKLADMIVDLNSAGRSIILIEHNLGEVMRICSRLVVQDNGNKIADGDPESVMNTPAVRAAYLGEDMDNAAA
ncbi:ABC transporter [Kiloniella spongiae]|uniref:ABC transporter n=1 Tax=Kiloniella spongiae TaxID=1489064 RepID=A0A0H2MB64_9PROT|nr:ABC transporter ATP-binding protein [Kiloniella spongiae]KLN59563.1 ABC transporter [Kiloniella spongiae]